MLYCCYIRGAPLWKKCVVVSTEGRALSSIGGLASCDSFGLCGVSVYCSCDVSGVVSEKVFSSRSTLNTVLRRILPSCPIGLGVPGFKYDTFAVGGPSDMVVKQGCSFGGSASSVLICYSPGSNCESITFTTLSGMNTGGPRLDSRAELTALLSPFVDLSKVGRGNISVTILALSDGPIHRRDKGPIVTAALTVHLVLSETTSARRTIALFRGCSVFTSDKESCRFCIASSGNSNHIVRCSYGDSSQELIVAGSPTIAGFFIVCGGFMGPCRGGNICNRNERQCSGVVGVLRGGGDCAGRAT